MTDLRMQRRLASQILKVGLERVWIDPEQLGDVASAITREDVKELIEKGVIKKKPVRGISRGRFRSRLKQIRKGRRSGPGSRKGACGARDPRKEQWMRRIRAQRRRLRELRDSGLISRSTYRMLYRKSKGGEFRSVSHLELYIRTHGLMSTEVRKEE
ncbi:50S ribosomal protein L19e [Methanosarcinales archaeon]|nr:MAG: 50S ribosomal protein L19e [Methanosarcinales archaeon]